MQLQAAVYYRAHILGKHSFITDVLIGISEWNLSHLSRNFI